MRSGLSPAQRDKWLYWTLPWLAPLLATGLSVVLAPVLPKANFSMIYLAGVVLTALVTRVRPALACAVLSFLAYNFFHTEPHFTLMMIHREDVLTVGILVLLAAVSGHLAARLNEKVQALKASDHWNREQISLAQDLARCNDGPALVQTLSDHLSHSFAISTMPYYRTSGGLTLIGSTAGDPLAVKDQPGRGAAVILAEDEGRVLFLVDGRCQGCILLTGDYSCGLWERTALENLVSLARLAWARIIANEVLRQETLVKEREQLRSALLSSISHDLRTPLATMIGSVSSLLELRDALDPAQQHELLENTLSECRRLDRYIQKLLDMTRLGHGELTLDRDWAGLDDILSVVIRRCKPLLAGRGIAVDIPADLPLLHVHPALIEQAIFNVLENALRYAPVGTDVRVSARVHESRINLDIHNHGPAIPEATWENLFDMFYTFAYGDQFPAAGTGLGLAICQGILGAHGGRVSVQSSDPTMGTTFRLEIPLAEKEQLQQRSAQA